MERIGCSRNTVHRLIRAGQLGQPHRRPGVGPNAKITIESSAVDAYLRASVVDLDSFSEPISVSA